MGATLLEDALDLLRSNQRTRGIMHSNIFCVGAQARQTSAHGILPMFAANNDGSDLLKASITCNLSDFGMSIFADDDHEVAARTCLLERADDTYNHSLACYL